LAKFLAIAADYGVISIDIRKIVEPQFSIKPSS
jgi:hypothetical protein